MRKWQRLVLLIIILLTFSFFNNKISAATIYLSPAESVFRVGDFFNIDIILKTEGEEIQGVGIRYLNYDPSLLEVQDSDPEKPLGQIKKGNLLARTQTNLVNQSQGKIEFSQLSRGGEGFKGSGVLARITFKALKKGQAFVYFDFTPGETTDTNVASNGEDILSLAKGGVYIIKENAKEEEMTREERIWYLKQKIREILREIKRLQEELSKLLQQDRQVQYTIPSSFRFSQTLKYGDRGNDVWYLQIFLKDQGPTIYPEGKITGFFGPLTRQAVIRFQEKYADDILTPWLYSRGTGVVGRMTRKKINKLLGR